MGMGTVYQVCVWYVWYATGMGMGMVWYGYTSKARHVARFGQKSLDCYGCIDPRSTWLATLPSYLNICLGMHTIEEGR
ncbi:uncharacterized protein SEPMUDRAFT_148751 [Sphaerulina musiva SO2202]|uniref:Uncharacterized protein n=1 Tax=Sphaerulina musiva (strain SO2202) TaxID=692275 RepID=M3D6I2_SPHMS|nr:uncharacterized protein SEPMUDRAFT_148751 [Sphaerulina musiva SO2202]EMF13474.1 hypothetical protein SEPMUDRAFT_148751 [Sphaerulina musiva SO2202]